MDADLIEQLSEKVHASWMAEKVRQGFADHVWASDGERGEMRGCRVCIAGRDYFRSYAMHHTHMLPYADLPEHVREYDRVTVRAVLAAIEAAGSEIVQRAPTTTPR